VAGQHNKTGGTGEEKLNRCHADGMKKRGMMKGSAVYCESLLMALGRVLIWSILENKKDKRENSKETIKAMQKKKEKKVKRPAIKK